MVGIHSRNKILQTEPYWGGLIICHDAVTSPRGRLVKYWRTEAMESEEVRENVREMVAILGSIIFEMIIFVS
jgi:hypothetical protein